MDVFNPSRQDSGIDYDALRVAALAPIPEDAYDTGVGMRFLCDLAEKHVYEAKQITVDVLAARMALPPKIIATVLHHLGREGRLESTGGSDASSLRLTTAGESRARGSLAISGYVGPTPVPMFAYNAIAQAQSVHGRLITRAQMTEAFSDGVVDSTVLDRLGPALTSGRAMFIYGPPGSGKTFITDRLARALGGAVLIPRAVLLGDGAMPIFDPERHQPIEQPVRAGAIGAPYDARFVLCHRPLVRAGGELSAEMLEVVFDQASKTFHAPIQMVATNGMLVIENFGHLRISAATLLNRWLLAMEHSRDWLTVPSGQHFLAEFDVVLVFTSDQRPNQLCDEALLRRIGYKIELRPLSPETYQQVWAQVCEEHGLPYDASVCSYAIDELHRPAHVPLLPCYPRELIETRLDHAAYVDEEDVLSKAGLEWTWNSLFASERVPARSRDAGGSPMNTESVS